MELPWSNQWEKFEKGFIKNDITIIKMWSQKDKAESNIIRMFYSDGIRFGLVLLKKAGGDANFKA